MTNGSAGSRMDGLAQSLTASRQSDQFALPSDFRRFRSCPTPYAADMDNMVSCISSILRDDPYRWRLLDVVAALGLPDCWIGAGFVRNAVWDHLHQRLIAPISGDVDVIWYDPHRADATYDRELEALLQAWEPSIEWSVKNQARMHIRNGDAPYNSATDAMRYWPETATAIAARREMGDCEIAAPLGLDDLFALILRPTPRFRQDKRAIYEERISSKSWCDAWPHLTRIED